MMWSLQAGIVNITHCYLLHSHWREEPKRLLVVVEVVSPLLRNKFMVDYQEQSFSSLPVTGRRFSCVVPTNWAR